MKKDNIFNWITIIGILSLFVWIGCFEPFKKDSISDSEGLSVKDRDALQISEMAKQYNASTKLNNIEFNKKIYTVQLEQDSLRGIQIISLFNIDDIIERDKGYYVKGFSFNNLGKFELRLNQSQFQNLINESDKKNGIYKFCVMQVTSFGFEMNYEEEFEEKWVYGSLIKLVD
jgi:hypothetical protein